MLLLYIVWDDWPIIMISGSNEQLQQELEYTLQKPACHSWWISKMHSGRESTLEERYAIKFCFKLEKIPEKRMECFRLLLDHLGLIDHQFLGGLRDSRKVGSLWGVGGVRKSEHQIDWPNKEFHRLWTSFVYRNNKFTVSCLCGNCAQNYSRGTEDAEEFRKVCPKGAQRRLERKILSWEQGEGRAYQFRSRSSWCSGDLRWKLDLLLWPRD